MIRAEGIPASDLSAAALLTDAGVQGSGGRFQRRQVFDEGRAANVIAQSLRNSATRPYQMKGNPYSALISSRMFTPGMGADDYDADMAERIVSYPDGVSVFSGGAPGMAPQPVGGSSADWGGVLKSIFSPLATGVGTGLSRLIGGNAPTAVIAPSVAGPSIGTIALVAGAIGIPLFLFLRRK